MHATMLILMALLTAQVATPTDERYPSQQPPTTEANNQPAAESEAAEPSDEPLATESNLFDTFDTSAQPLPGSTDAPAADTTQPPFAPGASSPLDFGNQPPAGLGTQPAQTPQAPSTATTSAPESETDPTKVLAGLLEAPLGSQLQGTPLTLAQAIENATSRADQTQRVVAYWELSQAVTNYYLTLDDRTKLTALRQGVTLAGAEWELATQSTDDRVQLALDRVGVAQQYLAQLMANANPGFSPLPADLPFTGRYETRYEQIFVGRMSPLASRLNEFLGRAHEDLSTRTHEIALARTWMFAVSDRRSPQSDGNELLKAYELFSLRRRAFVGAVKDYNLAIVRYTEIATPGTLDTERLVAMLIRTGSSPGTTFDRDVQRVNAEESASPLDSSSIPSEAGWGSSRQTSTERSILVPRG